MRALDIAIFIVCIELALTMVSQIGLFSELYYIPTQENIGQVTGTGYMSGSIDDTKSMTDQYKPTSTDASTFSFTSFLGAIGLFFNLLTAVFVFYIPLTVTFHIPPMIAVPIQSLIYITYSMAITQYLSGRSYTVMQ